VLKNGGRLFGVVWYRQYGFDALVSIFANALPWPRARIARLAERDIAG
jgi:hypothetical protein